MCLNVEKFSLDLEKVEHMQKKIVYVESCHKISVEEL